MSHDACQTVARDCTEVHGQLAVVLCGQGVYHGQACLGT